MMNKEAISAFIAAQATMGGAIKSAKNPFFKNTYADLSAIQEAVYPAFHAQGFALTHICGADQLGKFVTAVAMHSSGATFESKVYIEHKIGDMQSLGSAITYGRRYSLMALTGIPTLDDDGNGAVARSQRPVEASGADEARQLADKLIKFFGSATRDNFTAGHERAIDVIAKIRAASEPMALEVEAAIKKATERLEQ